MNSYSTKSEDNQSSKYIVYTFTRAVAEIHLVILCI